MNQPTWNNPIRTDPDSGSAMRIFTGQCLSTSAPPIVGKLIFPGDSQSFSGACLPVISRLPADIFPEETGTVGMIWIGDCPPTPEELAKIPCPILSLPDLPQDCRGKIALLDPACATLFVSPDLKTVNRYTSRLAARSEDRIREAFLLPSGKRLRLGIFLRSLFFTEEPDADGYLIDPDSFFLPHKEPEDGCYELLCDIAEQAPGLPLTVIADCSRYSDSHERFHARIRGLFRGAVYGNFSMVLRGILTEEELRYRLNEIHRVFCELESEGREFNGYIPKGILIRAPLLLQEEIAFDGVDFLCFDLERLFSMMTDNAPPTPELQIKLGERVAATCNTHPGILKTVLLGSLSPSPTLCRMLLDCGITEWYLSSDRISTLQGTLEQMLQEELGTLKKNEKK